MSFFLPSDNRPTISLKRAEAPRDMSVIDIIRFTRKEVEAACARHDEMVRTRPLKPPCKLGGSK